MPQGFIASLIGTIQDRLYPNKEITRASLKTGFAPVLPALAPAARDEPADLNLSPSGIGKDF